MKKTTKIFILILLVEITLLLNVVAFSGECSYPTPCSVPTFFNPLGYHSGLCVQVITPPMQCNLGMIYLLEWAIILTSLGFMIYSLTKMNNPALKGEVSR